MTIYAKGLLADRRACGKICRAAGSPRAARLPPKSAGRRNLRWSNTGRGILPPVTMSRKCRACKPMTTILKTEGLNKTYNLGGFVNRVRINALDDVNLSVD